MQTIAMFTLYVGATVVTLATALKDEDDGVCSKMETYMISQSQRVSTSFVQSYETCSLFIFCSTKYRTAYRLQTRTIYTTRNREYLVCCNGYIEVDNECKPKDATTLSDMSTAAALPAALPVQTMMIMISGAVLLLAVAVVVCVLMVMIVARRKRKRRSSKHSTEGNGNGPYIQPGGAYYSMIREAGRESGGTNADSATVELRTLPRDSPSASGPPTPARNKKNTFKNLSLFYAKIVKGKNKAARGSDVQSYDSGSHATEDDDRIVHYYSDMDTKRNHPEGYIDMASPVGTLAASSIPCTDMLEASNEYSEMDVRGDGQQYNEFEPYDKLDFPEKSSADASGYDHLERQDSLLPSKGVEVVELNPYDRLDKEDPGEDTNDIECKGRIDKDPYDHLKGNIVVRTKTKEGEERGRVSREGKSDIPGESLYYNTPEENALKRRESERENLYSNVA